jgi:hypothetical protein
MRPDRLIAGNGSKSITLRGGGAPLVVQLLISRTLYA